VRRKLAGELAGVASQGVFWVTPKPLSRDQRRVVLFVELHWRQYDRGPSWRALRQALGITRARCAFLLHALRARGAIVFIDDRPGSLRATPAGVRAAIEREGA
jgi:hypothetical protein